jgi:hypothetical protein
VFGTMQRRILEYQVLLAYAESTTELPFTPTLIRPASNLAGSYVDFSTEQYLIDNYDRGYQDGRAGWQQFTPPPGMEPT